MTGGWSADYIDAQYQRWLADPDSVPPDWRLFFEDVEPAGQGGIPQVPPPVTVSPAPMHKQARVDTLIHRYRDLGHLLACLDPLVACPTDHPLLNPNAFGLQAADMDQVFAAPALLIPASQAPLRQIIQTLKATYCRSIGVEYMHLQDPDERRWLQKQMEPVQNRPVLTSAEKKRILTKLVHAALFESFLHKKYLGQTRFSLDGADALISLLDILLERQAANGCREIVLGMAHRGRLNVQVHFLQKSYYDIFAEFENCYDPESVTGAGDVKYHNGFYTEVQTSGGPAVKVLLVSNPSHLESVNPVVEGVARARQDMLGDDGPDRILPLLIHGDAAFAGQGIVAETLNMSQLQGYRTGGTIHLVVNNQIGYTTLPEDARSTRYATDVAKMLMVPIFHVHGENPEAVTHVARMAADYRNRFHKDVVIDLVCYRRYGHNEGDEPYFTQPTMYQRIKERPVLHQLYGSVLKDENVVTDDELESLKQHITTQLEAAYKEAKEEVCRFPLPTFYPQWEGYHGQYAHEPVATGVPAGHLQELARRLNRHPADFTPHPKLGRLLANRLKAVETGTGIDWANAESLAFGSLLTEGYMIRLSGQDSRRGTFSQRHCDLIDYNTGDRYAPFDHLAAGQGRFYALNSLLSEAAVVGYEYGYAMTQPEGLTLWEAQFGDFANNAQAIIDLYIAAGETKWRRLNSLVMLLPHGFEGLGPEHSSARLERFLQLCADDNMQVGNLTTPAQYFHVLRRQLVRKIRKPLILMTPKSLLRHPLAVSGLEDLTQGHFQEVIADTAELKAPKRVLLCSGKIYYELYQRRFDLKANHIAIIRVEQFYPFPAAQLKTALAGFDKVRQWYWVQEEPENMGAFRFMQPRLEKLTGKKIKYIGRSPAASPATGFVKIYRQQQDRIIEQAIGPPIREGARAAVS